MTIPSLYIDYPEHETVALATMETGFPDWRKLVPNAAESSDVETIMLGAEQLGRVAKVGKLYASAPTIWHFNGPESAVSVAVGPIRGLLMPSVPSTESDVDLDEHDDQISLDELEEDDVDE